MSAEWRSRTWRKLGRSVPGDAGAAAPPSMNGVRALPLELREALLLVVLAGFSHREAAEALDIPLTRFYERLERARERLADVIWAPRSTNEREFGMARRALSAGHQVTERFASTDVHAYVDECLGREDRIAFEASSAMMRSCGDGLSCGGRKTTRYAPPFARRRGRADRFRSAGPRMKTLRRRLRRQSIRARARASEAPSDAPRHSARTSGERREPFAAPCRSGGKWAPRLRWAFVFIAFDDSFGCEPRRRAATMNADPSPRRGWPPSARSAPIRTSRSIFAGDSHALAGQISPRFVVDATAANFDVAGWRLIGARFVPGRRRRLPSCCGRTTKGSASAC